VWAGGGGSQWHLIVVRLCPLLPLLSTGGALKVVKDPHGGFGPVGTVHNPSSDLRCKQILECGLLPGQENLTNAWFS